MSQDLLDEIAQRFERDRLERERFKIVQTVNYKLMKDQINELKEAYFKLPVVVKEVKQGTRGGLTYKSPGSGRKTWLKKEQKAMCASGELKGAMSGCPQ